MIPFTILGKTIFPFNLYDLSFVFKLPALPIIKYLASKTLFLTLVSLNIGYKVKSWLDLIFNLKLSSGFNAITSNSVPSFSLEYPNKAYVEYKSKSESSLYAFVLGNGMYSPLGTLTVSIIVVLLLSK